MVIGVCGFGYSGSGAVLDMLKGYEELCVFDKFEFSFSYSPDGIDDLKFHLVDNPIRYMSGDIAIKRFFKYFRGKNLEIKRITGNKYIEASEEFVNSLVQIKWRGYWMFDYFEGSAWEKNFNFRLLHARVLKFLSKRNNKTYDIPPVRDMYLSVCPKDFELKARLYLEKIMDSVISDKTKPVVLNQPFRANNPEKDFAYYNYPKAIIVDRDPRDLYVLLKKIITYKCRFIPCKKVEDFIEYYKALHIGKFSSTKDILYVKFEDLVYDFEVTKSKIQSFIGINGDYFESQSQFDPMVSIENTHIYDKYPDLVDDIKRIEECLPEWLYEFDSKSVQPVGGKSYRELIELADK